MGTLELFERTCANPSKVRERTSTVYKKRPAEACELSRRFANPRRLGEPFANPGQPVQMHFLLFTLRTGHKGFAIWICSMLLENCAQIHPYLQKIKPEIAVRV